MLESPNRVDRFRRTRWWSVIALIACCAGVVSVVVGQATPGLPDAKGNPSPSFQPTSLSAVLRMVAASNRITTLPEDLVPPVSVAVATQLSNLGFPPTNTGCVPGYAQGTVPACLFGDRSGSRSMLLYGDSHAGMWFRALDEIARRTHWRLILLFKPACLAGLLPTHAPNVLGQWTACDRWHRFALNRINRIDPDLLIVTQSLSQTPQGVVYTPKQWQSGLEELLQRAKAAKLVVLGDIPLARGPGCLAQYGDAQACSPPARSTLTPYERAERRAGSAVGAHYVNVTPWFCAAKCSPVIGSYNVYFDPSHVAVGYSRFLEGVLSQALGL